MSRQKSRPVRWANAISEAQAHLASAQESISELVGLQEEYVDWRDNIPENLEDSPIVEKLDAIADLELEDCFSEVESTLEEAENAELPLGFGRD